ncbi:hypothetical protein [Notoacmeibacter sp. MSK16QG-6]|uniref:hypothetical protein n=1 Tax=Notoacmeibacter sp. MSK16QG-6 TaxID=2957982 RepID=UPI00209DF076|nr:hypothetical protein [Notoacmeibacter sp. MSK16QG-6]MCP1200041.1 hypothetical protein [Notoacmeibacter sp. MSK16QG-6]
MPQWAIDLLGNPAVITAIGTGFVTPILTFLAYVFMRRSPPKTPVAYDARDLPDHPLLVSAKVHLVDEHVKEIAAIRKTAMATLDTAEKIHSAGAHRDDQLQLIQDRLDLLMRK